MSITTITITNITWSYDHITITKVTKLKHLRMHQQHDLIAQVANQGPHELGLDGPLVGEHARVVRQIGMRMLAS